jgi:hypothetical protein
MEEKIANNIRGHIKLIDLDGKNIYNGKLKAHDIRMALLDLADEMKKVEDDLAAKDATQRAVEMVGAPL